MTHSRCVQCGLPKDKHLEGSRCPSQNTQYATMQLPDGAHCSDCVHIRFCTGFLGDVASNSSCDWYPIRFRPISTVDRA
jgi:hypothetical protein